jgi:predicted ATPase
VTTRPTGSITVLFAGLPPAGAGAGPEAVRAAVAAGGGWLFRTAAELILAAFPSAGDALTVALGAQHALAGRPPSASAPLPCFALSAATAYERDGEYLVQPIGRGTALLAAGHPGQILVSAAAARLLAGDVLPGDRPLAVAPGAALRSLGAPRLRDLRPPEPVYQVVAPNLPAAFPPLRTLDSYLTNLPIVTTSFVGREFEVAALRDELRNPNVHLLTLTGPGGAGKTRVALQVAGELLEAFPDGVYFVALSAIRLPALVVPTIAQTLRVKESGGQPLHNTLADSLHGRHLLLVLDNFEQIATGLPPLLDLLERVPGLKLLITSRVPLQAPGERTVTLAPLAIPERAHGRPAQASQLLAYEAVQLFVDRAYAVDSRFRLSDENAPAVAEICRRLDGLPLAIELAAARSAQLAPQTMLDQLHAAHEPAPLLNLAAGGAWHLSIRQQTLRGAVGWSYNLLDAPAQQLFARLAVFAGGATLEAVRAIALEGEPRAPGREGAPFPDALVRLIDSNLVRVLDSGAAPGRVIMLETIREYAAEQLAARGQSEELRRRHAGYYLALAEQAELEQAGAHQVLWLDRLEAEHANLRVALEWVVAERETTTALRLGGALWRFWLMHGHLHEGRGWLRQALALPPREDDAALRAKALNGAGVLAWRQDDYRDGMACLEASLELRRAGGDRAGMASSLNNLGVAAYLQGDYTRSHGYHAESLALWREVGNRWGVAQTLNNLGQVTRAQGDPLRADQYYLESLALWRELGTPEGRAIVLCNLGYAAHARGADREARDYFAESLVLRQKLGDNQGMAECLIGLAVIAGDQGQAAEAARLCAAAEGLLAAIQAALEPVERADFERAVAGARARLGESAFAEAWSAGRTLSTEQAVAAGLRLAVTGHE